jgi:hypothetical protein
MPATLPLCELVTINRVEVYAESLYEAVLRGLSRLQDVGWESASDLASGLGRKHNPTLLD